MPGKSFVSRVCQWWLKGDGYWEAQAALLDRVRGPQGVFASDALITWGRNLGFLDDKALTSAWDKHARDGSERGILWRTAVLAWAARMALKLDGGFMECGCYAGTTARILLDAIDFKGRDFYLYDLFETPKGATIMPEHGEGLYERVLARFPEPNAHVVRGLLPASFKEAAPDKVAFAHIDMNNAAGELATLNALEPLFTPGAIIVLDDFGQLPYQAQHEQEAAWFARRGLPVLELPTGQGLVIWAR
jgi:O-methyltransferase